MLKRITQTILLFGLLTMVASCKSDNTSNVDAKEAIYGRWEIYKAKRNMKTTASLDRAAIVFKGDSLQSNLFQKNALLPYSLNGSKLDIKGDKSYDFDIRKMGTDTLVLSGQVGVSFMEMFFKRVGE